VTENNRRAREYRLTRAGRSRLTEETDTWLRYSKIVTSIMTADPRPSPS